MTIDVFLKKIDPLIMFDGVSITTKVDHDPLLLAEAVCELYNRILENGYHEDGTPEGLRGIAYVSETATGLRSSELKNAIGIMIRYSSGQKFELAWVQQQSPGVYHLFPNEEIGTKLGTGSNLMPDNLLKIFQEPYDQLHNYQGKTVTLST